MVDYGVRLQRGRPFVRAHSFPKAAVAGPVAAGPATGPATARVSAICRCLRERERHAPSAAGATQEVLSPLTADVITNP